MRAADLFTWMVKRHRIYERRQTGMPKPWTQDLILQRFRFCNVYRELDTVTVWINKHWRQPHLWDPDVWFAMVVARLINWPDSLAEGFYPVPWDTKKDHWVRALNDRKERKVKVFTGAYMIHADATHSGSKVDYLAEMVLTPMWERRDELRPKAGDTLNSFHKRLMTCRDMGSFMAGQVVCDTKYVDQHLKMAPDWWTWACPGPGSMRGLNRVFEREKNSPWRNSEWLEKLGELHKVINILVDRYRMPLIHAQDLQNCLCEFDKYERVRLGEGLPRSLYPGRLGAK